MESNETKLSVFRDIMLELFDDKSMAIIAIVAIIGLAKWGVPVEICTGGIGAMAVVLGKTKTKRDE